MTATPAQIAYISRLQAEKAHQANYPDTINARAIESTVMMGLDAILRGAQAPAEVEAFRAEFLAARAITDRDEMRAAVAQVRSTIEDAMKETAATRRGEALDALTMDPASLTKEQASRAIEALKAL